MLQGTVDVFVLLVWSTLTLINSKSMDQQWNTGCTGTAAARQTEAVLEKSQGEVKQDGREDVEARLAQCIKQHVQHTVKSWVLI